jgi:hypothetical protein
MITFRDVYFYILGGIAFGFIKADASWSSAACFAAASILACAACHLLAVKVKSRFGNKPNCAKNEPFTERTAIDIYGNIISRPDSMSQEVSTNTE